MVAGSGNDAVVDFGINVAGVCKYGPRSAAKLYPPRMKISMGVLGDNTQHDVWINSLQALEHQGCQRRGVGRTCHAAHGAFSCGIATNTIIASS